MTTGHPSYAYIKILHINLIQTVKYKSKLMLCSRLRNKGIKKVSHNITSQLSNVFLY